MTYALPLFSQADIDLQAAGYTLASPSAADLAFPTQNVVVGVGAFAIATAFGVPDAKIGVTLSAASTAPVARFGYPTATTAVAVVIRQSGAAASTHSTAFGQPAASATVTAQANSTAPLTAFGPANAVAVQAAASVAPTTMFGAPSAGAILGSGSLKSTSFGKPTAGVVLAAGSTYRTTLWGRASALGASVNEAEPASTGVFFGQPTAARTGRALSLAPSVRFGKPLLQRGALC